MQFKAVIAPMLIAAVGIILSIDVYKRQVYLFHRAVADIDKRSGIGITARVLTAGMFVEQGYFAPSVVEEAGQALSLIHI